MDWLDDFYISILSESFNAETLVRFTLESASIQLLEHLWRGWSQHLSSASREVHHWTNVSNGKSHWPGAIIQFFWQNHMTIDLSMVGNWKGGHEKINNTFAWSCLKVGMNNNNNKYLPDLFQWRDVLSALKKLLLATGQPLILGYLKTRTFDGWPWKQKEKNYKYNLKAYHQLQDWFYWKHLRKMKRFYCQRKILLPKILLKRTKLQNLVIKENYYNRKFNLFLIKETL